MTVAFRTTGPAADEAFVARFEATLPEPLPVDYRDFLLGQNGGWAPSCWWPPEAGDADFATATFYSLGDVADYQSLVGTRQDFLDRMPSDFVAIGDDVNGNQLCLLLAGDDRGSVWFFDHELETDPEDGPDPHLLTRICGSFTEMLATLEPYPDLKEMDRRIAAASKGAR